jgi:hypothetical protein
MGPEWQRPQSLQTCWPAQKILSFLFTCISGNKNCKSLRTGPIGNELLNSVSLECLIVNT